MWRLRESTHPVLTDDGGAILDERTGRWTHLTPTAAAALRLLLAGATQEEAAGQYALRYRIGAEQAAADVRTVADALTTQGLAVTGPVSRRRWGRWWR
ncbi:Coenzyme PQQ synthesis protein D (PqqD) [Streptomyces sp. 2323.1]|uniref:PqqD family peptide modification chaperone n=1 Tax=Streptomyces sp. 2323.1 TaxID=1938841 RepID=UPI000BB8E268|nr:PqqD family peptide modification chaperone [Streptomyces sp. 2323.1]SOE10358.1 Coenzyme PQQ synthesis protein D (PqqD) [Streptomyces sp. 2323.1]